MQIENEAQVSASEKEAYLSKVESDLVRIRNARDELLADQQMRKAAQEQERSSVTQMKELLDARESRITSLESEVQRLQVQVDGTKDVRQATTELSMDELRTKYETLDKQYELLNSELLSMQAAFKRTSKLANQKITELASLEDKIQRLIAEKSKADQKYFAAMKSKEARDSELRILRVQNMKSSDIISQLKESESSTRNLVSNVEKQLAETKEALNNALSQYRSSQQQVTEANIAVQGLRLQVAELKALLASRDASLAAANSNCRKAESTAEGLKTTLADTKKSLESWKAKGLGNSSSEYEMLRVSDLRSLKQTERLLTSLFRLLRFAPCAAEPGKTPLSKPAAMYSAKSALKNGSHPDPENAPTATSRLATMTTCISPFKPRLSPNVRS